MIHQVPKVKFFTKNNGESIAFAIHGSGPVLVVPAWWVSHIELDWKMERYKQFFLRLGEYFTVVRYDRPGAGLSDRGRSVFTLEDEVNTLSELVDHLDFPSFSLLGVSCGGPPCISYAQANPERIKQIIFIDSYVCGADIGAAEMQGALCTLVSAHWGLGAKAILDLFDPNMDSETRKKLSAIHKKSASATMAEALLKLSFTMNASDAANQLNVPALVIHHSNDKTVPFDAGRKLAAMLRNSQLVSINGKAHLPWMGDKANDVIKEIIVFSGVSLATTIESIAHNQFKKSDNIWILSYAGKTMHIKDSRGLNDIALLICSQHKEIHVAGLIANEQYLPQESQSDILDSKAIQQYKHRLKDLLDEKNLASLAADEMRYAVLEQEEDLIINTLKQSVGLGGHSKQFNHNIEKARKAVAARIRVALNQIELVSPDLATHLRSTIKTGNFCSYVPKSTVDWLT